MKRLLLTFCLTLLFGGPYLPFLYAQSEGSIITSAIPTINNLDPNGDGWITSNGSAFLPLNEDMQFELNYLGYGATKEEPKGDLSSGSKCGKTDIVSDLANGAFPYYALYQSVDEIHDNGDDILMFRIRSADTWSSGSFGYHILIDTDGGMGFSGATADVNAVSGNPGFEIELIVRTGGTPGVFAYDVDGGTVGTSLASYILSTNYQQSKALYNSPTCSGTVAYHDFFVNLADIGLTTNSSFRFVAATSQSGSSILNGSITDLGGIDDDSITNTDSTFIEIIEDEPTLPIKDVDGDPQTFPVELIDFTATPNGNEITLNWTVGSQTNNDYYTLEKSYDGKRFTVVGRIDGLQNSLRSYETMDIAAVGGQVLYRLSQTDLNGTRSHLASTEVSVAIASGLEIVVYPNPSNGIFNLEISASTDRSRWISIENLAGQNVWKDLAETAEYESVSLDLRHLPSGLYFLSVNDGEASKTKKIRLN